MSFLFFVSWLAPNTDCGSRTRLAPFLSTVCPYRRCFYIPGAVIGSLPVGCFHPWFGYLVFVRGKFTPLSYRRKNLAKPNPLIKIFFNFFIDFLQTITNSCFINPIFFRNFSSCLIFKIYLFKQSSLFWKQIIKTCTKSF